MFTGNGGAGKIDNPFVQWCSTCMWVRGVAAVRVTLCCGVGHCGSGRCGGYWCGRNIGSGGRCGRSRKTTGWHIWLSAQTADVMINVVENLAISSEIMMVSMDFVVKPLKLIDLFGFDFVMAMVFYSVNEGSSSF